MDYQTDVVFSEKEFLKVYQDVYRANDPQQFILHNAKIIKNFDKIAKPSLYPCVCISWWNNKVAGFMDEARISAPQFIFLYKQDIELWGFQLKLTKKQHEENASKGFIV